ncbi:hypothetical protein M404DRAFT_166585 [Pisolithus tinctorius Marx 270]|uniref:Uncharacterized protein n=1 Tax=Pisolithus tinctorius Marx 270 TaxID=870435 RepID=A0A0C3JBT7_PISTI|nr:hypothetical protein M404DRAFT_166585 [Pisolithus tinctorius Marx 270]
MSCPTTHAKNAHQHPGYILLEGKQVQCTSEQKQADNAQTKQARLEQAQGIKCLANIVEETECQEKMLLTDIPKPRPKPHIVSTIPVRPSEESELDIKPIAGMDVSKDTMSGESADLDGDVNSQQVEVDGESPTQVVKKQRNQKTSTQDAVEAVQGGNKFADSVDKNQPKKGKHWASVQASAKGNFAGIGEVKDWADKLASSRSLHTLLSQWSTSTNSHALRSTSTNSCVPRSISGTSTDSAFKVPHSTLASSAISQHSFPDHLIPPSQLNCGDYRFYIDEGDLEPLTEAVGQWTDSMDITEVVSSSEIDKWEPSPPPATTQSSAQKGAPKGNITCATSDMSVDAGESKSGALPSKQPKPSQCSASGSQHSGSGVNRKYVKDNLPLGSTVDNIWRQVFISALAHFTAGYDNPWTIPTKKFMMILQVIWDRVYEGEIEHTITNVGPIFHIISIIAKQSLNNWHGGFATAAPAVITTFFANDTNFKDPKRCVEFAKVMLKRN